MNKKAPWCFVLHVSKDTNLDQAWDILQSQGNVPLYTEEDSENLAKIYIQAMPNVSTDDLLQQFPFIEYAELQELGRIDWDAQWQAHGLNFHDGYVHIDLPKAIQKSWMSLKMKPGAGFGDLSHPTTSLVLEMMKDQVKDQYVVDIGSGSGVLAICAIALGAKHVEALDIDADALIHSQENAALNEMTDKITVLNPQEFKINQDFDSCVILMNMTMEEQRIAWDSLKDLHHKKANILTSGILDDQKEAYLKMVGNWGWKLVKNQQQDNWIGFQFSQ